MLNDKKLNLTEEEENTLEKNIVWIIGMIRSGTTWYATQLLRHEKNIIWNEPLIGSHLYSNGTLTEENRHRNRDEYFFSTQHEDEWIFHLRKFILARTYHQWKNFTKNIIIKEPTASPISPILMKCFPNSKLIFMQRDGRDVVDSIIDSHREGSWTGGKSFKNDEQKLEEIERQSKSWNFQFLQNWKAYENHNPNLRFYLKYENLMTNTLEELKKSYQFLKIDVSDEFLEKQIEKFDFKNIPDSKKGTGKFNRSATPGAWKTNFNKKERNLLNLIMGETLQKFDYEV